MTLYGRAIVWMQAPAHVPSALSHTVLSLPRNSWEEGGPFPSKWDRQLLCCAYESVRGTGVLMVLKTGSLSRQRNPKAQNELADPS